jgi:Tfp pilus assembly protein PilO
VTRAKAVIPVAVLVIAAIAYWFLVLAPKREDAAALATQISAAEAQLQQAEATASGYEAARASYRANYTRMASLGKAVPADDDVRSLLLQLDTTAAESDVDFQIIDSGDQSGAAATPDPSGATSTTPLPPGAVAFGSAGMAAMPFSFQLNGKFLDLTSLLGKLEQFVRAKGNKIEVNGRLMRIESVSLDPDAPGSAQIRAQINATTYLMPAAAEVEAAPTADAGTATTPAGTAPADTSSTPAAAAVTAPTGMAR